MHTVAMHAPTVVCNQTPYVTIQLSSEDVMDNSSPTLTSIAKKLVDYVKMFRNKVWWITNKGVYCMMKQGYK